MVIRWFRVTSKPTSFVQSRKSTKKSDTDRWTRCTTLSNARLPAKREEMKRESFSSNQWLSSGWNLVSRLYRASANNSSRRRGSLNGRSRSVGNVCVGSDLEAAQLETWVLRC